MATMSLPCVQEVLTQVLAYASVVLDDERQWQSSLPSLLCACRGFRAFWLALGIGQIQHSPGAIVLEGHVDLEGLRIYLRAMPHAPTLTYLVHARSSLSRRPKLWSVSACSQRNAWLVCKNNQCKL